MILKNVFYKSEKCTILTNKKIKQTNKKQNKKTTTDTHTCIPTHNHVQNK